MALKSSVAWGDDGWFDWIEFAAKEVLDVLDDVGAALEVLMFKSAPDVALLVVEKAPNYTAAWRVVSRSKRIRRPNWHHLRSWIEILLRQ